MNRSTLAALVVALMLGSGIAGYVIGKPKDSIDRPTQPTVAAAPTPAPTPAPAPQPNTQTAQTTPAPAPATPVTPTNTTPAPAPAPTIAPPFTYTRYALDTTRPEAEACLVFNRRLVPDGVRYSDFVRIEPEVKSALRVMEDRLCIGGLSYGDDYKVKLLADLPGADGGKLPYERTVEVSLGARPAVVNLPGKGFILPRGSAAGIPVTTINVSKVGISVYRVNERAIDRFANDRWDATYPGTEPQTDSWSLRRWLRGDNGKRIWRGTMDVKNLQNQSVITAFPIRETIQDWKPGAYYVVVWDAAKPMARDYEDDEDTQSEGTAAGMWVIDTDIALTTFTGVDGLNVFARSLQTALPLAGLEVVLLSRGNEPIGKAITDDAGRVSFAAGLLKGRGAAEAFAVMATDEAKKDFSRLELTKSPFDLSDRGISGRDQPGPVDAFLYTERGIYRPGETVQLMAMLRDNGATSLADMPVTLIVKRPDGSEFTRYTAALQGSGAIHQAVDLPKSSRRGRWSVTAHIDPKAPSVGRVEFTVEDFVPEKLKVELKSDRPMLRVGEINGFSVQADFLYGAPASGLTVEADMRVTVDASPFADFSAYQFGPESEREKFEPPFITMTGVDTDQTGKSRIEWGGDKVKDTVLPLRAQVQARVFEPGGGRATKNEISLPVRTRNVYLGIRPAFEGRYAQEGAVTSFDLVAVDADGKQIARPGIQYRIERLDYTYQWYQVDGRWRWQSNQHARLISSDTVTLKGNEPMRLALQLYWGSHRLTVIDTENNTSTTLTFYVGWYGGDSAEEAPDTLRVASDKQNYKPGETARVRIEPTFTGEALVAIATDRIVATYPVKVPSGGATVEVPIKAEWGAGAYALVTAWRPLSSPADRTPTRAIGATWLGLDPGLRTLGVQISTPDKVTPRQRIEVPVKVSNLQNEEAYITLAAVDEGILQLTRYRTPDPASFYFGKRRLGVSMRDDYGRLLDTKADEVGRIRVGGDAGDIGGLDVVPTRTVSLFSGPVKLDGNGEAKIGLDIPDFIGQLRVMVVAYSKTRVGAGDQRLFVRDAVTADVVLPRFLAPGDRGRVSLSLHNVDGQAGDYQLTLEASGMVALDRPVAETRRLATNQRELLTWDLKASEVGFGKVAVAVRGPGDFAVRREWDIQVRAAQTPSAVDTVSPLEPQRQLTVDRNLVAQFAPGTTSVSVALSRIPGIDVPGLLRALDKYPYGCLEQTTSRALPLLYYNDVALLGYAKADINIPERVQEAIYRIIDMQMSDGSFGMWGPYYSPAAEWLQAYALDFLLRARDQQMNVPAISLQRGLAWLNRSVEKFSPNAQAYAWYVLAKGGLADPGRIRYFQDTKASDILGGLAWTQLAAALNHVAEPGRARLAFSIARQHIDQRDPHEYYGSPLRNRAALIALAPEAGGQQALNEVVASVREQLVAKGEYTTTQEQAWLLLAARAMGGGDTELAYSLDGEAHKASKDPVVINPDRAAVERGVRVTNDGNRPVWLQVTARGVPTEPQPAASQGLTVERRFFALDGKAADLNRLRQNERVIVSIRGRNIEGGYHEAALLDLLPAGFEIESVLNDETVKSFSFLDKLTETRIAEARDDRFFASFNLGRRYYRTWWDSTEQYPNSFHVAYVVRAVTPGSFALPAVNVSDMYAPRIYARSAMGHVTIAPR